MWKKLFTHRNLLDIVTSLSESSFWSRLHVRIMHVSGVHNSANTEPAELCKTCVIKLLEDALSRVRKGERASEGVESSDQEGWE